MKHLRFCSMQKDANPVWKHTISLNRITYRIIFGDREEMVVKSGKYAMPVLEMLL